MSMQCDAIQTVALTEACASTFNPIQSHSACIITRAAVAVLMSQPLYSTYVLYAYFTTYVRNVYIYRRALDMCTRTQIGPVAYYYCMRTHFRCNWVNCVYNKYVVCVCSVRIDLLCAHATRLYTR